MRYLTATLDANISAAQRLVWTVISSFSSVFVSFSVLAHLLADSKVASALRLLELLDAFWVVFRAEWRTAVLNKLNFWVSNSLLTFRFGYRWLCWGLPRACRCSFGCFGHQRFHTPNFWVGWHVLFHFV